MNERINASHLTVLKNPEDVTRPVGQSLPSFRFRKLGLSVVGTDRVTLSLDVRLIMSPPDYRQHDIVRNYPDDVKSAAQLVMAAMPDTDFQAVFQGGKPKIIDVTRRITGDERPVYSHCKVHIRMFDVGPVMIDSEQAYDDLRNTIKERMEPMQKLFDVARWNCVPEFWSHTEPPLHIPWVSRVTDKNRLRWKKPG